MKLALSSVLGPSVGARARFTEHPKKGRPSAASALGRHDGGVVGKMTALELHVHPALQCEGGAPEGIGQRGLIEAVGGDGDALDGARVEQAGVDWRLASEEPIGRVVRILGLEANGVSVEHEPAVAAPEEHAFISAQTKAERRREQVVRDEARSLSVFAHRSGERRELRDELAHRDVRDRRERDVLVEKPIAHTVAAAQRMREAAIAAGVCLQVGHIEQFNPAVVDAKRRLADGEIGDLMAIHCRRFCAYPKRITDVGVTLDLGIHDLELAVSLDPSPVRLLHGICASKSEIGLDEHIIATHQVRSGVTATIEESWIAHRHERTVLFVGTRGTIAANLSHPHLSITLGNNAAPETLSTIEVPIARSNALADEWRAFVAAILTGTEKVQVDRAIAAIDIATQLIVS